VVILRVLIYSQRIGIASFLFLFGITPALSQQCAEKYKSENPSVRVEERRFYVNKQNIPDYRTTEYYFSLDGKQYVKCADDEDAQLPYQRRTFRDCGGVRVDPIYWEVLDRSDYEVTYKSKVDNRTYQFNCVFEKSSLVDIEQEITHGTIAGRKFKGKRVIKRYYDIVKSNF
jgi:hypothetical protein